MFARTEPLRRELRRTLPERPFAIRFWDGTTLPSSTDDGPTFSVQSPQAVAHALRAPGQLGLGRAYVAGTLTVDDLDAALALIDEWRAPPLERGERARLPRWLWMNSQPRWACPRPRSAPRQPPPWST